MKTSIIFQLITFTVLISQFCNSLRGKNGKCLYFQSVTVVARPSLTKLQAAKGFGKKPTSSNKWIEEIKPESSCPCSSGKNYNACCQTYHQGEIVPTPEALLRSRYTAYATKNADFIIKTTHRDNPDYSTDTKKWKKEIIATANGYKFLGLKIKEIKEAEEIVLISFESDVVDLRQKSKKDSGLSEIFLFSEKSKFKKEQNAWKYLDGSTTFQSIPNNDEV